jgi:hypothetical protein
MSNPQLADSESPERDAHTAEASLGPRHDLEMPPDFAAFRAARARALDTMRPLRSVVADRPARPASPGASGAAQFK